jgi:hypothetical protein
MAALTEEQGTRDGRAEAEANADGEPAARAALDAEDIDFGAREATAGAF